MIMPCFSLGKLSITNMYHVYFIFQPGLRISHHADDTLNSFCQWQATVSKRKQHDHAVLLTGVDICSFRNAPCDTLGKL